MLTHNRFFRRFGLTYALAMACILCSDRTLAQTWPGLKVSGQNFVDSYGKNIVLKGFGVGEWTNTEAYMLEWPDGNGQFLWYYGYTRIHSTLQTLMGEDVADQYWRTWNANVITESDVERWQSWGVNAVRLSINYHWLSPADGVYLDSGWQWIDRMIVWCKAHHIYVILCMHAAPGGQNPELMSDTVDGKPHLWTQPSIYQPWTIHLWQAIAQRYADESTVAGYDLLDEPLLSEARPNIGGRVVRDFYVKTTAAIRSVDSNHIIFACGTNWCGSPTGVKAILPTWDDNLVLVFHKYWDNNNLGSILGYLEIRRKSNVPLWNGETGENSNAWAEGMADLLRKHNIGWSWWTYKKLNQNTNPCSIPEPANYSKILDYVDGNGLRPSQAEADTIMLRLADNSATVNCTWNERLVRALFGLRDPSKTVSLTIHQFHNGSGEFMDMDKLAQRVIRPAVKAIGLPWFGWHGFRRGIASNLYELGANEKIVQRILRHAKPHVTKDRYIKAFDPAVLEAMQRMQATVDVLEKSPAVVQQMN